MTENLKKTSVTYERNDGFGAQYQHFIFTILYAEFNNLEYVHTKIKEIAHDGNNDVDFMEKINTFMNLDGSYLDISQVDSNEIYCASNIYRTVEDIRKNSEEIRMAVEAIYRKVEENINVYASNNPSIDKIKRCFWEKKDRNFFKNNKHNVAVHIRRVNAYNVYTQGSDTPNEYYLNIINHLREKYKNKDLQFHIYSEGNIEDFNCFLGEDVVFHINEDLFETYTGFVAANILVTSASSLSYSAAFLTDGEVYYLPMWHPPKKEWVLL